MSNLINFELLGAQMRMLREDEEIIRENERRKFVEWLDKSEKYSLSKVIQCWEDSRYDQHLKVDINEILSEYKQIKGDADDNY